jgi:hypothetical protein
MSDQADSNTQKITKERPSRKGSNSSVLKRVVIKLKEIKNLLGVVTLVIGTISLSLSNVQKIQGQLRHWTGRDKAPVKPMTRNQDNAPCDSRTPEIVHISCSTHLGGPGLAYFAKRRIIPPFARL